MIDLKKLTLAITIFVVSSGLTVSIPAFAEQETVGYHTPATSLTDPYLVCGDHECAPGEMPHHPFPVEPVRGH